MGRTSRQLRTRTTQAMSHAGPRSPAARRTPTTVVTRGQRLRYAFDNTMARGTSALVAWLALATLVLIVVFTVLLLATRMSPADADGHRSGFFRSLFVTLNHALDAGAVGGDTGSWRYLVTMLVLTVAGLFIVSALIGVIAAGIDERLSDLRRGRSLVIEKDHTIVLGWSDAVFTILRELAVANESRRRPVVVVLSERDKVEMEEAIREKVPDLRGTRVVCRTGSPIDLDDLALTNHAAARSVIVLSPGGDDPDSDVIKTMLALLHGSTEGCHVVAEIQDPSNLEAAYLVGGDRAVVLNKQETIARLIVQTSRQSGAAAVYTELFDFDGDEIYFHSDSALDAATYAEALQHYAEATMIGVVDEAGDVRLNPPGDTPLRGRVLVLVAADDSALGVAATSSTPVDDAVIVDGPPVVEAPSRMLVIGWNERAATVVRELDAYAAPGSTLVIATEFGAPVLPPLTHLTAHLERCRTTDRASLERLDVTSFAQVIVLCYSDDLPAQRADARTLVTLLHVRDLIDLAEDLAHPPAVVSEMLDDRNRALASVAQVDDVIVSDEIVSLMLTQLSEEPRLAAVFEDLLDEDGAEIYLRPADRYVTLGAQAAFATVVEAAARKGETALGYRVAAQARDASASYGVRVNPSKATVFVPAAGDRVIVLAQD